MRGRDRLAREAVAAALRVRTRFGRRLDQPVCPFELAEEMQVTVRFEPLPSLEGMYSPEGPVAVIGSLRPAARRSFTCAHELGHHVLGHGLRIDEASDSAEGDVLENDNYEYAADRFAAALLMPKIAVERAFTIRKWKIGVCTPEQAYTIAGIMGVGYITLIGYMDHTLLAISASAAHRLRQFTPQQVRKRILGFTPIKNLVVVDSHWTDRSVDIEIGDLITLPDGVLIEGKAIQRDTLIGPVIARAVTPGIAAVKRGTWSITVRVCRTPYRGLAVYRHLEDPDHED